MINATKVTMIAVDGRTGKVYKSAPAPRGQTSGLPICEGCAARNDTDLCLDLPPCGTTTDASPIIWKEQA